VIPILGITMGDAAGAGPEIICMALGKPELQAMCRPLVVGHAGVMEQALRIAAAPITLRPIQDAAQARFTPGEIDVLDTGDVDVSRLVYGRIDAMAGGAAYACLERATKLALEGRIDAVVTSALNKEALNLAGHHYAGHTEILADLCGVRSVTMMLVAGNFRVTHVSTHCSMRQAIERVKAQRILEVIRLTDGAARQMGVGRPHLAVAGLNPHAGEGGLFGDEEITQIQPAIEAARGDGFDVHECPLPPDTVFYRMHQGQFDAVVAMYHDQGHIPVKIVDFAGGVNVTLGLPIIRTSVDHGTVFGKAGKGTADPSSLIAAMRLATQMALHRPAGARTSSAPSR
jgi:4-phospho-D-threonate 3-dehydrogenase / 4-phospho-D-erythronate 3-dehydrogenase